MAKRMVLLLCSLICLFLVASVSGHGRLMDPPARNAMWRFGFKNPVNYNDNELYCGGFIVHIKNGGKCGVCGDNYKDTEPRDHEAPGLFANGIIASRYLMGQEIEVEAELTTNHKGTMKIELCVHNNPSEKATEECFKKNVLPLADGSGDKFIIPEDSGKKGIFRWKVKLPDGLVCSQCIMRWTYKTANTWGTCNDGSESVGCGNQETFINCADVRINTNTNAPSTPLNVWQVWVTKDYPGVNEEFNAVSRNEFVPLVNRFQVCLPKKEFQHVRGMGGECMRTCLRYPPTGCTEKCTCIDDCVAIGSFAKHPQADLWCHQNCIRHPSFCPASRCRCT